MPEFAIVMTLVKPAPGGKTAEGEFSPEVAGLPVEDFSQIFNALLAQSLQGSTLPQAAVDAPPLAVSLPSIEDDSSMQLPVVDISGADNIAALPFLPMGPTPPQLAATAMELEAGPLSTAQAAESVFARARDEADPSTGRVVAQFSFDPSSSGAKVTADFAASGTFLPGITDKSSPVNEVQAFIEGSTSAVGTDAAVAVPTALETTLRPHSPVVEQRAVATVQPRMDHAEWKDAFSRQVVWMANQQHQQADIQLNPPNLGPVEVRLTLAQDQASVMFISPHAAVRDAIQTALPRLNEMLANSGLTLGNVFVGSETAQQQAFEDRHAQNKHSVRDVTNIAQSGAGEQGVLRLPARHYGMVDLFA